LLISVQRCFLYLSFFCWPNVRICMCFLAHLAIGHVSFCHG
jgi:hypothetical protein